MDFNVTWNTNGNVYINGRFVAQCCYDGESVGSAIANWLTSEDSRRDYDCLLSLPSLYGFATKEKIDDIYKELYL